MDVFNMAKPILKKKMQEAGIKSYLLTINDAGDMDVFPYSTNVKEFIDKANERIISLNEALKQNEATIQAGYSENFELQAANIRLEERIKELEKDQTNGK